MYVYVVCYYISTHIIMIQCSRFRQTQMLVKYIACTNINSCMTMRYITNNHNKWVGKSCTKLFAQVYLK